MLAKVIFAFAFVVLALLYYRGRKERVHLANYALFLLLSDEIVHAHRASLHELVRDFEANNAMDLYLEAMRSMDHLASELAGTTAAGVHAGLWALKKGNISEDDVSSDQP